MASARLLDVPLVTTMKVYGMAFERPGDRRSLGAMADIRGSGSPARKRPRSGQA